MWPLFKCQRPTFPSDRQSKKELLPQIRSSMAASALNPLSIFESFIGFGNPRWRDELCLLECLMLIASSHLHLVVKCQKKFSQLTSKNRFVVCQSTAVWIWEARGKKRATPRSRRKSSSKSRSTTAAAAATSIIIYFSLPVGLRGGRGSIVFL